MLRQELPVCSQTSPKISFAPLGATLTQQRVARYGAYRYNTITFLQTYSPYGADHVVKKCLWVHGRFVTRIPRYGVSVPGGSPFSGTRRRSANFCLALFSIRRLYFYQKLRTIQKNNIAHFSIDFQLLIRVFLHNYCTLCFMLRHGRVRDGQPYYWVFLSACAVPPVWGLGC